MQPEGTSTEQWALDTLKNSLCTSIGNTEHIAALTEVIPVYAPARYLRVPAG